LIFDELFTVFDSRGEFSRLNVFFISTVKKTFARGLLPIAFLSFLKSLLRKS